MNQAVSDSCPAHSDSIEPQPRLGHLRNWYWRGRCIRYSFRRAACQAWAPANLPEDGLKSTPKPPILLIHGFGAGIGHWRNNIEVLSQHHNVYAIDLLGFGHSEKAQAPYSPFFWADQIHDFWQTFIGRPTILIGNSLGSVTAMMAAAKYPAMAEGLVWINLPDSSVLAPDLSPTVRRARRLLLTVLRPLTASLRYVLTSPLTINPLLTAIRPRRVLTKFAKQAYANPAVVDDELMDVLGLPAYDRGARQALRAMTRFVGNVPDQYRARYLLPQLTLPMLLIWGQQDSLVPPFLGPKIAALNPRIRLVELDQAGHCPQDECADRVNPLILGWIAALA